jgi:hypothetical protein
MHNYARECVRLVGLTRHLAIREGFLNLAREWMATALHEPRGARAEIIDRPQKRAPGRIESRARGGLCFAGQDLLKPF